MFRCLHQTLKFQSFLLHRERLEGQLRPWDRFHQLDRFRQWGLRLHQPLKFQRFRHLLRFQRFQRFRHLLKFQRFQRLQKFQTNLKFQTNQKFQRFQKCLRYLKYQKYQNFQKDRDLRDLRDCREDQLGP